MRLFVQCPLCSKELSFISNASTRVEWVMENGNTCPFECKYCGSQNSIHANKVFAKESKIALFLAILVFLLGTAGIVWWVYILFAKNENMGQPALIAQLFGLVTIPSMVYYVIAREDAKRVRIFNAGKVRNNS